MAHEAAVHEAVTHPPAGHIVRFVDRLDHPTTPPAELPVPRRVNGAGRVLVGIALAAAAVGSTLVIRTLWTEGSPGWWFSALFTVFIALVALGLGIAYVGWLRRIGEERSASAAWRAAIAGVRGEPGTVTHRDVRLGEDGDVLGITMTVRTAGGAVVGASWRPTGEVRRLLQPQVPGVGSSARVWRAPGAGPVLVDVLDPTVVRAAPTD
ncbi:hypothetical protein NF556_00375 [Ornithinimicrobium faecis]|uniref:Uncharacterized protein n=1 Tax=Ornithinimicrobium faecis TaxID=2934158 RepID=A0ABY4YTS8_9MICO|nr:hypothetical protein [Ornithinimicrobium sp. HY1793]USQ80155.1 hypothetical protein NF556_00375 [Ornithinimicrobium sp. HY1793]